MIDCPKELLHNLLEILRNPEHSMQYLRQGPNYEGAIERARAINPCLPSGINRIKQKEAERYTKTAQAWATLCRYGTDPEQRKEALKAHVQGHDECRAEYLNDLSWETEMQWDWAKKVLQDERDPHLAETAREIISGGQEKLKKDLDVLCLSE